MRKLLFKTDCSYSPIVMRVFLGLVLLPHGAQKLLGWFGGYGLDGTLSFFTENMHIPYVLSYLVVLLEFFGSIALIAGFCTRLVSASLLVLMIGIIITSHLDNGFFMNWFGNQKGEGYEYHLLYIGGLISLIITGAGRISMDKFISINDNYQH